MEQSYNNPNDMMSEQDTMNQMPDIQANNTPWMGSAGFRMTYPEVYYKVEPYIMMVCDQMEDYGYTMPTQAMSEQMTDYIYDNVIRMYPELAEYAGGTDMNSDNSQSTAVFNSGDMYERAYRMNGRGNGGFDGFGDGFRRRGMLRDLIDILFLSELFGRRRNNFY